MRIIKCSVISKELRDFFKTLNEAVFTVHSVFSSAFNLVYDEKLVTVLSKGRDTFPYSMVLDEKADFEDFGFLYGLRQHGLCKLSFKEKKLQTEGVCLDFANAELFECDIFKRGVFSLKRSAEGVFRKKREWAEISVLLPEMRKFALKNGSADGVLPLLSGAGEVKDNIWSAFLRNRTEDLNFVLSRVFRAEFERERLTECFGRIAGAGPGLTPSGDDFITGVLSAVNSLAAGGFLSEETAEAACRCARGVVNKTNSISGAFILQAAEGLLSRSVTQMSEALFCGDVGLEVKAGSCECLQLNASLFGGVANLDKTVASGVARAEKRKKVLNSMQKVMDFGSSSGTDIITGYLFALNTFNEVFKYV